MTHRDSCTCSDPDCLRRSARMAHANVIVWGSLLLALLAFCFGCGGVSRPQPPQPPPGPTRYDLDVQVSSQRGGEPGVTVEVQDGMNSGAKVVTDTAGHALMHLASSPTDRAFTVCANVTKDTSRACSPVPLFTSSQRVAIEVVFTPHPTHEPVAFLLSAGRHLTTNGHRLVWRFATGFELLDLIADGNISAARSYIAWLTARGFNGVRVLSTAQLTFQLAAADGRRALPELFTELTNAGLNIELVALADTAGWSDAQLRAQVSAINAACVAQPGCALEIANEPYHETQASHLHDNAFLHSLMSLVTVTAAAEGASRDDEDLVPAGRYITRHRDRSRDKWNDVRRVRELEAVSSATQRFTVDDEPIGANEVAIPQKRENDPSIFYTQGVLCRVFDVGCSFHFEDGIHARVPRPVQDRCAQLFIEGTHIVPDTTSLTFKNATWSDSPVKAFNLQHAVRVYSGIAGNDGITVAVGLSGDPAIVWQNGWASTGQLQSYPGVTVWRIHHQ